MRKLLTATMLAVMLTLGIGLPVHKAWAPRACPQCGGSIEAQGGPPEPVNPDPLLHDQIDRLLGVEPWPWVPGAEATAYPDIPNLQSLAVTLRPRTMALQPMATPALRWAATARIAK